MSVPVNLLFIFFLKPRNGAVVIKIGDFSPGSK